MSRTYLTIDHCELLAHITVSIIMKVNEMPMQYQGKGLPKQNPAVPSDMFEANVLSNNHCCCCPSVCEAVSQIDNYINEY